MRDAIVSADRVAALVGDFDRSPAYAGLAAALRLLIGDGRLPQGARLPSERELTDALAVSRTTVTRAYAQLREDGYAQARHGSGTFTRVPGGRARSYDRALTPAGEADDVIDLNCAAGSAAPGILAAYAQAAEELPRYLGGHGYFPAGLPVLQEAVAETYAARGLPTAPEQIMITPGALSATAIVTSALLSAGDRVLVEAPVYPNATQTVTRTGGRLVEVPLPDDPALGWDLPATAAAVRRHRPSLSYLIPDFQNPTGAVMGEDQRSEYAELMRRSGTVALIDEAHQQLALDGQQMPRPFADFLSDTVTVGSASKVFWGGLRLGWIRAPHSLIPRLMTSRLALDLGAPVLEQLVLARLLGDSAPVLETQRARLHEQREALCAAVTERLPDWRFHRPGGGLSLWCELPSPLGSQVAVAAEQRGVIAAPGTVFAARTGFERYLRLPWTQPAHRLETAVDRLADAWRSVAGDDPGRGAPTRRVMVA